jgi:hypothetical protein
VFPLPDDDWVVRMVSSKSHYLLIKNEESLNNFIKARNESKILKISFIKGTFTERDHAIDLT